MEVNATKLAPLVLICIVALTVVAGVGFALTYGVTPPTKAAVSKDNTDTAVSLNVLAQRYYLMGDPIDDPKPNKPNKT